MQIIYTIGIRAYYLLIWVFSAWDSKAKQWISGRKGWREKLEDAFRPDDKVIWFHCASLGEFEQGRSLIEKVRTEHAEYKILLTFFSPSGYEKRKNFEGADYICYLPKDSSRNAKDFLNRVPVHKVFFIKYEFWYYFLRRAHMENIPLYLASGNFQRKHLFFRWYGSWFRGVLDFFTHIFVQDKFSEDLLQGYGYKNVTVAGDTRFDRVIEIAKNTKQIEDLVRFSKELPLIIAGSTWEKDEDLIASSFEKLKGKCKLIIAPHEPSEIHVNRLKHQFRNHVLFSELHLIDLKNTDVIIVDTIGHLSSLYRYGDIAYIGGGFGKGIHNILEATAAGLPVLFGPNYQRFKEAVDLLSLESAFVITNNEDGFETLSELLSQAEFRENCSRISKEYTQANIGATNRISEFVFGSVI